MRTLASRIHRLRTEQRLQEEALESELRQVLIPHGSARQLAKLLKITSPRLSELVNGKRGFSDSVVQKLMGL